MYINFFNAIHTMRIKVWGAAGQGGRASYLPEISAIRVNSGRSRARPVLRGRESPVTYVVALRADRLHGGARTHRTRGRLIDQLTRVPTRGVEWVGAQRRRSSVRACNIFPGAPIRLSPPGSSLFLRSIDYPRYLRARISARLPFASRDGTWALWTER